MFPRPAPSLLEIACAPALAPGEARFLARFRQNLPIEIQKNSATIADYFSKYSSTCSVIFNAALSIPVQR
jgi:hypothetical protein